MFKNHLTTALRYFLRNRTHTSINIIGLAAGLACFLLIALFVKDELSYENTHVHAERIYRLSPPTMARTAPALAPAIKADIPEIEQAIRFMRYFGLVENEDRQFFERNLFFAEADVLHMLSFEFVAGDPTSALDDPNTLVLTEGMATKYFGHTNVLGKNLTILDSIGLTVTGVIRDLPHNTHLPIEWLASFETYRALGRDLDTWSNNVYYTYVKVAEGTQSAAFQEKVTAFTANRINVLQNRENYTLTAQSIKDIHLHSDKRMELAPNSKMLYIYIFSVIGLIILLIAAINFVNLSTAMANRRAREVAVRKTVGAGRPQLIRQFLGESLLLTLVALTLGFGFAVLGLPFLNELAGKDLDSSILFQPPFLVGSLIFAGLIGIVAGAYPAFVLSSFRPKEVLKGRIRHRFNELTLRRVLVGIQYGMGMVLLVGMGVVFHQLQFLHDRSLGFDKEQVLVVQYFWDASVQERYQPLKEALLQIPEVGAVTASGDVPGRMATTMTFWAEGMPEEDRAGIQALYVDRDFVPTYGIEMQSGRPFDNDRPTDLSSGYLINEAAATQLGWTPETAIGKRFSVHNEGRIIGVMKDFHFNSLHQQVQPLFVAIRPSWAGYISVRLSSEKAERTVRKISQVWKNQIPDRPLHHFFLDDDFNRQYLAESKLSRIVSVFAILALLIAGIGLFGMATYTFESKTKEIAVRKVLGAQLASIISVLTKDLLRPLIAALIVSLPVAFYVTNRWLESFAYQAPVDPMLFIRAVGFMVIVVVLAISFHTIRAASANPVSWLRNE